MHELLKQKILILSDKAWERKLDWPTVERWLSNFTGKFEAEDQEKMHALYLLTQTMYFGQNLIREMLRSVYQNLFRYPLVIHIRRANNETLDPNIIESAFCNNLRNTRFLGIGNPSESGPHLLYYFRQINELPKDLFIDAAEILSIGRDNEGKPCVTLRDPNIERYIFIDDLLGSGTQMKEYLTDIFREIRSVAPQVEFHYYALFATTSGLEAANSPDLFNGNVQCIFELDDSFKCFGQESRSFKNVGAPIDQKIAETVAAGYGNELMPGHPLGYKDGQLLLALSHNTPDNSLPILWFDFPKNAKWAPVFKRFAKLSFN
ncbi:hypothetical protein [Herbaspirillum frisingense]|uniref:phosphoribosyltransferase-like protein n=1 Tax=Herbaspirillum frisingense TaxID=92645 RepID=UPI001268999F|nr:hypothetical protein [Herbaspirillum frisingense]